MKKELVLKRVFSFKAEVDPGQ
ncbi:unnamed protein product [Callosobruchus maculatus]|uniref:Uncharacterized protein n=1 Tax=Callosobruchus maculatus TaxID=64391 RepID=A0A653BMJ7_CALMS|nr:unnamed protein product [Callosobruchus maculatus]